MYLPVPNDEIRTFLMERQHDFAAKIHEAEKLGESTVVRCLQVRMREVASLLRDAFPDPQPHPGL